MEAVLAFMLSLEGQLLGSVTGLVILILAFVFGGVESTEESEDVEDSTEATIGQVSEDLSEPEVAEDFLEQDETSLQEEIEVSEAREPLEIEEDEEVESPLHLGLSKTRKALFGRIAQLFTSDEEATKIDEIFEGFEELLIQSDLGVRTSSSLVEGVREELKDSEITPDAIRSSLKSKIGSVLETNEPSEVEARKVGGLPKVIFMVGVNGSGKTTTCGKLAFQFGAQGSKVLLAACDTFRAAAADQLQVWAERAGASIERGADNEKPSTVAYRAVHRAIDEGFDVLLVDTAGRLHTKVNLMKELSSVTNIVARECEGAPHETFLVVDGSSGQNALQQAREFNTATELSGVVVSKLDGTPKGGIVIAIKDELKVPVRYIGVGEGVSDLRPFDSDEFVEALFGDFDLSDTDALLIDGQRVQVC